MFLAKYLSPFVTLVFLCAGLLGAQANPTGLGRDPVQNRIVVPAVKTVAGGYSALPPYFDLRKNGRLTPIRDQGQLGTCWTFATYGALESNLQPYLDPQGNTFSEQNLKNTHGFAIGQNNGGTALMAMAYLARWSGPVPETLDPYSQDPNQISSPAIPASALKVRLQSVDMVMNKNYDEVKKLLMTQGALFTSINAGTSAITPYYNERTAAFYNPEAPAPNHAVVIVGWDDNYPRANFKAVNGTKPQRDGAFIMRNSWGTGWGDQGYFYASYEDRCLAAEAYSFVGDPQSRFNRIYQYDTHGAIGWWSGGTGKALYGLRFTAKDNEDLQAVGLFTDKENTTYQVSAGKTLAEAAQASPLAQDTLRFPGYHTVRLDKSFPVAKGSDFFVVVRVGAQNGAAGIPLELAVDGYVSRVSPSPNTCFVTFDGNRWDDVVKYNQSNIAFKVFSATREAAAETPKVTQLVFDAEAVTLAVGESRSFKLRYLPGNAAPPAVSFMVAKDDAEKVKIDQAGSVTALKPGTVDLLAVTGDKRVSTRCRITIPTPDPALKPLVFADPALEASFLAQLGKKAGPLTTSDLKTLTGLKLSSQVKNLAGIEAAPALETLDISGSGVSDLSPLAKLGRLKALVAQKTAVASLVPLKKLTALTVLDLGGASVKDPSPLKTLGALAILSLSDTDLGDGAFLADLKGLERLDLRYNRLADVSALAGLTQLKVLYLAGNPVKNYLPLKPLYARLADKDFELRDTEVPEFADGRITDLVRSQLRLKTGDKLTYARLAEITELDLSRFAQGEALKTGGLEQLTSLVKLTAPGLGLADGSFLAPLTQMRQLKLYKNKLTSLAFTGRMKDLVLLDAGDNQIADLSPLAGKDKLEELYLDSNKITALGPLASLASLKVLNLSGNQLKDAAPFAQFTRLEVLNLAQNALASAEPFSHLTQLKTLFLRGNKIGDFSSLKSLRLKLDEYDFEVGGKTFDPATHDFGKFFAVNDFFSDADLGFVDEKKFFAVDESKIFTTEEAYFGTADQQKKAEEDFFGDKAPKSAPQNKDQNKKKSAQSADDSFFDTPDQGE